MSYFSKRAHSVSPEVGSIDEAGYFIHLPLPIDNLSKDDMDIHSHEGAGPIRFGMARGEVLDLLAAEADSFKRSLTDVHPCDYFTSLGCFVYYADTSGLVEAIEFAAPAKPILDGVDLLSVGFIDLLGIVRDADPEVSTDTDGFTSVRLGIGGWAPFLKSAPNLSVEAIIVFAPGYYD